MSRPTHGDPFRGIALRKDGSLPSYEQLFGELGFWEGDEARSVHSPAAYLVDLLRLARRPDLGKIPLDAEHTFTDGKLLRTVGLNVGGNPWTLVLEGDKTALSSLTYRARASVQ